MKIVFNTDQIYLHGGIEKVLTEKANCFVRYYHHEVIVLTTGQKNQPPCYPLDSKIRMIDMGVDYNRSISYFSIENLKKSIQHFRRQRKLLKELKPDIIISPNFNFDYYWLPFIKGKSRLIKERHGSHYLDSEKRKSAGFIGKLKWKFNDWIDSKYDHIVVLNPDEKKYVKSANAVVISNPVSIPEFSSGLNSKKVLAAGRLAPVKAFDELIQIWKLMGDQFPNWQLHIYGDDYLNTRSKLQQLIESLGLQHTVFLKDSVPDLTETMKDYSIYALTSVTECFSMVLLESLAVGVPVVSYDCPTGPRNIITDTKDGFLIEERNQKEFAAALGRLMTDLELRKQMGKNGKQNVRRFSAERVMAQWQQFLNLRHV